MDRDLSTVGLFLRYPRTVRASMSDEEPGFGFTRRDLVRLSHA